MLAGAVVTSLMSGAMLPPEYLQAADLPEEEAKGRKKAYLVTLPHPRVSGQSGLLAPGRYDRRQVIRIMQNVCLNPV